MVDSAVNTAPSVDVAALANPRELSSPILAARAEHATRPNVRQYVARIRDKEAGYLSFEDRPDLRLGVIYEVYVLAECRSRGVGSALLRFGEDVARRAGYS